MKSIRDSKSAAKNQSRRLANSSAPMKLTCSTISGASGVGSTASRSPRITTSPGISRITPSDTLISVGVPQPILAIGPIRTIPGCCGKIARMSLRILRRIGDDVGGEEDAVDRTGADALASGSSSTVR